MTPAQVERTTGGVVIETRPPIGVPWANNTRLPWQKPHDYSVRIPALGVSTWGFNPSRPVGKLDIDVDSDFLTYPQDPHWQRFKGALSCGISFAANKGVTRHDIVNAFGEPAIILDSTNQRSEVLTNLVAAQRTARSVSALSDAGAESLYYWKDGIIFALKSNAVRRITVIMTSEPSNATNTGLRPRR